MTILQLKYVITIANSKSLREAATKLFISQPALSTAIRELEEETGLVVEKVLQIGAYSKVDRDPRGRTISVAYLAVIDKPVDVTGQDDAAKAQWFPIDVLPPLAFDHEDIIRDAIALYKKK